MLINYMSDLHTEFDTPLPDSFPPLKNEKLADVLILAGDILVLNNYGWIESTAENYKDVIYIMGNHEYYNGRYPDTFRASQQHFYKSNVHVLENSNVLIEGVRFHGATMWTDGGKKPDTISRIDKELNDFRLIRTDNGRSRFSAKYSTYLHEDTLLYLEDNVAPGDVVVTHHAPSFQSMHPRYANDMELNSAYMSPLDGLVKILKPSLWFHGHVHTSFDYLIGKTRVLCNPRGYYRHEENPEFNRDALVEL